MELPADPLQKSWYVIIGGPFEGARFGNYDHDIRQDVERCADCRAYGPSAGVLDETTATRKFRDAREQRLRDTREQQQTTSLMPAPAPRPKPASAPANPALAHVDVGQQYTTKAHAFVPPLYQPLYASPSVQIIGNECQNYPGPNAGPNSRAEEHFDDHVGPAGNSMTLAAFAAGRSQALKGSGGLQMPGIGFDALELYEISTGYANEALQVMMRAYPLTTYLVMAVAVITSSQPSTYARFHSAYRPVMEYLSALARPGTSS
eukprot:4506101-Pleurochrysis_carterae.AAC.2